MTRKLLLTWVLATGFAIAATVPRPSPEFAVQMMPSGQTLLSQQRGKVVLFALISTTCPHCQKLTQVVSGLQGEYGPRGFQALGAAFNPMSHMLVGDFIRQFRPTFPVGWTTREATQEYLQHSAMMQLYVPAVVFIDRKGVIRGQYLGEDPFFQDQEKNLRAKIEELLKEPSSAAKKTTAAVKK